MSFPSFNKYRQMEFGLANDLRYLQDCARDLKLEDTARQIGDAVQRLENHTFSIAVVGEFRRGKSTFINALLGKEILPSDVLPTSATLNRVTFGLQPLARIYFKAGPEGIARVEEVPIEQLAAYVTKLTPEARAMAATVREAVVEYPVPYCQNNVDIIDTPGLGDEAAMTDVTMGVLPHVDAAIMIVLATAPFSDSEGKFLDLLLDEGLGHAIFVINGLDRIDEEDRARVVDAIRARITACIVAYAETRYSQDTAEYQRFLQENGAPRVFGLSGKQALQAKRTNDAVKLQASRFAEFEAALEKFLTEERGAVTLAARAAQAGALSEAILKQIDTRVEAFKSPPTVQQGVQLSLGALLGALEGMGQEEIRLIEQTTLRVAERVQPALAQWESQAKAAAGRAIETAGSRLDFDRYDASSEKLADLMGEAVCGAGRELAQNVARVVETELAEQKARLAPFAMAFDRIMQYTNVHWLQIAGVDLANPGGTDGDGTPVSLLVRLGAPTGYTELEPAAVGSTRAGDGSAAGAMISGIGCLASALDLPAGWAAAACSADEVRAVVFGATKEDFMARQARMLFRGQDFKRQLNRASAAVIEAALRADPVVPKVNLCIGEIFDELRRAVEDCLVGPRQRLLDLHNQRQVLVALNVRELQDLAKMRTDVEAVRRRAQGLGV